MNIRVKELLGLAAGIGQCYIPTRANVIEAGQFCKEAKRIIDTDLEWQDRINSDNWMNRDDEFDSSMDRLLKKRESCLNRNAICVCFLYASI